MPHRAFVGRDRAPDDDRPTRRGAAASPLRRLRGLGVLLALAAVDQALTAAWPGRDLPFQASPLRVPSALYDHDLRPGGTTGERWGDASAALRTNSLGFKDRSTRRVDPAARGRRVLFMGDSFTEGIGVDYERTFVGLVDARLRRDGVEVLNGAVVSYSPVIYWRKVRYLIEVVGLRFDELVVFIDVSDVQDEAWFYERRGDAVGRRPDAEARVFGVTPWMRAAWWAVRHSFAMQRVYAALPHPHPDPMAQVRDPASRARLRGAWTVDPAAYAAYGATGLALAERSMSDLAALLAARGIRLTVAVYPWPIQIFARDRDSLQVSFWRRWADGHGADFLDLFPRFIDGRPAAEVYSALFFPGDCHWNAAGHRVVADAFLDHYGRRARPSAP